MVDGSESGLEFIEASARERSRSERRRARMALGVSGAITLVWVVYMFSANMWDRAADHVAASITMIFGSFVAGSTPQGGGAVAFPVFTKGLGITPEVARSFSLFIQTVGMGAASAAILIRRIRIEWRALAIGLPVAVIAFLLTVYGLGDAADPFLRPRIPGEYVKVTFTLTVVAMALITWVGSRVKIREIKSQIPVMNRRTVAALVVTAAIGGVAAGLTGSGADVLLYLFLGILLAVDVKVGVPTSVLVMAGVSVVGFVFLGLVEGQMAVSVSGERVTEIGGMAVDLDAATSDLFGLWLAAIPVVAWGGPLGAWVASKIDARKLVVFVVFLAALELVTTAMFVPELRTDVGLLLYAVFGGLAMGWGLWWLADNRERVFKQPGVSLDRSFARKHLDVAPGYRDEFGVSESADSDREKKD